MTNQKIKILVVSLVLTSCSPAALVFSDSANRFEETGSIIGSTESQIKLGNRFYLISHLESIFGPLDGARQKNLITANAQFLGGRQDFYETYERLLRDSTATNTAEMNPSNMAARHGLVIRVCNAIAQDDVRVKKAVENVIGTSVGLDAIFMAGPTTSEQIQRSYEIFFPMLESDDQTIASLKEMTDSVVTSANGKDAWRFLFLTFCLDPAWQAL